MTRRFRNLFSFFDRLIYWLPILWRDRDWDSSHLYFMMSKKIERIRASTLRARRHVGYEKSARNMMVAEQLLLKMSDGTIAEGCPYERSCPAHRGVKLRWSFDLRCAECEKAAKRRFKWMAIKEKADEAYLWRLMEKQSGRWWD